MLHRKGVRRARILAADPLFPWDKLPDSPDLITLRFLLDLFPDQDRPGQAQHLNMLVHQAMAQRPVDDSA